MKVTSNCLQFPCKTHWHTKKNYYCQKNENGNHRLGRHGAKAILKVQYFEICQGYFCNRSGAAVHQSPPLYGTVCQTFYFMFYRQNICMRNTTTHSLSSETGLPSTAFCKAVFSTFNCLSLPCKQAAIAWSSLKQGLAVLLLIRVT